MKIGIYARVSKFDGTQDPANQLQPLRDFAKALNGEVVAEYTDLASGGNGDRENFLRMFEDADKHKFDLLLTWSLDRLSREGISNTLGYIERLNRAGVALKSLQESWLDTRDEGLGKLMIAIFSWVASQERKRIIERTKAALSRKQSEIEKNGFTITKAGKQISQLGRPFGSVDRKRRIVSGYLARHRREKAQETILI